MSSRVITFILFWAMANFKEAHSQEFTNMWLAANHGGENVAQRKAMELGCTYKGQDRIKDGEVKEDTSKLGTFSTKPSAGEGTLSTYKGVTKNFRLMSYKPSAYIKQFNDPLWPKQWYDQDYRLKPYPVMDHNVVPVYKMGITGKGVTVAVVDDGIQKGHPDLEANYNYSLSWDVCQDKPGSEPDPPTPKTDNSHGTNCAGVVGMVANNNRCGVGIAYEATLAGIKILGSTTVDYVESQGLVYNLPSIDIYLCAWGPVDNGFLLGKIPHLSDVAFEKGVTQGRNGKGAIYVLSAGNGRNTGDNCGADGYTNHKDTITVAAAGQDGKWAYYSERCSAVFTTGYSGTSIGFESTVATGLNGVCDFKFSGTTSASSLAAGIIALALQANPNLTYRDVMHLITMSSEVAPLADNGDTWYRNGQGFWVSNDFGFGLINAENMVNLAKTWKNVPKQNTCIIKLEMDEPKEFSVGKETLITFKTNGCKRTKNKVRYLEQVQVTSKIQYPYRGAITMTLISPAGTKTALLESRSKDDSTEGLDGWVVKTVHNWGEDPRGIWHIIVTADPLVNKKPDLGFVHVIKVNFHGTRSKPSHFKNLPREYAAFRLSNGKTSED